MEELLEKARADEGKPLNLMYEVKLKSSFKIKMDMKEAEEKIQLSRSFSGRVRGMQPIKGMLSQDALERLKLEVGRQIQWK